MKLPDYHLHTNATDDGTSTLLEIAETAARAGLGEIAITDHYIHGITNFSISAKGIEQHFKDAETALERFGIKVLIGLEADYFQHYHNEIENFLHSFDFDIILGSGHMVEGHILPDEKSSAVLFRKFPIEEVYTKSYDRLIETIQSGLFDVMAHMDIFRRFGAAQEKEPPFEQFAEQAEHVCAELLRTDTGFEANCRGYDHAPAEQYPSSQFLAMLARAGVTKVTIGSDAHAVDKIGLYLERGLDALQLAGFSRICKFRRRTPQYVEISELDRRAPVVT